MFVVAQERDPPVVYFPWGHQAIGSPPASGLFYVVPGSERGQGETGALTCTDQRHDPHRRLQLWRARP